jgi:NAD(P)-dependent dehydrogenase (short-subunit alcohol dehydrogenase family)
VDVHPLGVSQQWRIELVGQLDGKTAVVTGGTSGIGLATVARFASEGARVFVTGRRKDALDTAVATVGGNVTGIQGDVSKLADLDRLYAAVAERSDGIDVVFANAGGGEFATLEQVTEQHFDETFGNNVKGVLFTVQKALPLLNDGASIILAGSTAASVGNEAFGVYGASKATIRSFGRTWAKELRGRSIRVNTISPGTIDTPGIDGLAADQEKADELKAFLLSEIPLGRLGRPEDVAAAALFLASDQSTFITGIELFVDGGTNQV